MKQDKINRSFKQIYPSCEDLFRVKAFPEEGVTGMGRKPVLTLTNIIDYGLVHPLIS